MSDSEERDVVDEVIAEDAEGRKIRVISAKDADGETFVRAADYDALRQQLADVSHERDLLRASQQWISCRNAMPPEGYVICYRPSAPKGNEIAALNYYFYEGRFSGQYKVTHWMPLPNPPTEQKAQS